MNTISHLNFFQLTELLDSKATTIQVNFNTHKKIIGIALGDKHYESIADTKLPNLLNGITLIHSNTLLDEEVKLIFIINKREILFNLI